MRELIQCEVRLYFLGRIDYDTEYMTATSPTDMYNKAKDMAKERKAIHFNVSSTTADEIKYRAQPVTTRRPGYYASLSKPKDQIEAIETVIGKPKYMSRGYLEP